jgi:acyl-CoA thioesterase I
MAPFRWRPSAARCLLAATVLCAGVACGADGGASGAAPSSSPTAEGTASSAPSETGAPGIRFAVIGDSITAGSLAIDGDHVPGTGSWVPTADAAPVQFVGGTAVPGATTEEMRRYDVPEGSDVVVLMAGTNDVLGGVPWEESRSNLLAIGATAGETDVILSAVPPSDLRPRETLAYNERLRVLAAEQEWAFIDPWTGFAVDGRYAPGASADGIHPTPAVAAAVGLAIRAELRAVA